EPTMTVAAVYAFARDVAGWLAGHQLVILVSAGLFAVVLAVALVWQAKNRDRLPDVATWVSVVIATGFSAEGMWEVARHGLELSVWQAVGLFAVFEAAMTSEAIRARRRVEAGQSPGAHGVAVWTIAASAGFVSALNAAMNGLVVGVPVRFAMPLLAAWLWWLELTAGQTTRPADAISWRYTPRRILVQVGLAEPGERDVLAVDRARQVAKLTKLAHRLHHGTDRLRGYRTARLRRWARDADDTVIADARAQVDRLDRIADLLTPARGTNHAAPAGVDTAHGTADRTPLDTAGQPTSGHDTGPDVAADTSRMRTRTSTRTGRGGRGADTAAEVFRLHAEYPDMTQDEIADRIGVSDRTVRRHLAAAMNGHTQDGKDPNDPDMKENS
ncbi:MAG: sigma factor-like helix-turn-helix DNA-binding protein, partial [Stackebrandtia sp.]